MISKCGLRHRKSLERLIPLRISMIFRRAGSISAIGIRKGLCVLRTRSTTPQSQPRAYSSVYSNKTSARTARSRFQRCSGRLSAKTKFVRDDLKTSETASGTEPLEAAEKIYTPRYIFFHFPCCTARRGGEVAFFRPFSRSRCADIGGYTSRCGNAPKLCRKLAFGQ